MGQIDTDCVPLRYGFMFFLYYRQKDLDFVKFRYMTSNAVFRVNDLILEVPIQHTMFFAFCVLYSVLSTACCSLF